MTTNLAGASPVDQPVGRPSRRRSNPWNITEGQARVLDAVCTHGCQKTAARRLGLSLKTVQAHSQEAGLRMGFRTSLAKYLAWDRWMRAKTNNDLVRASELGYPECSGDPASCPENEGTGCCGKTPNARLSGPQRPAQEVDYGTE